MHVVSRLVGDMNPSMQMYVNDIPGLKVVPVAIDSGIPFTAIITIGAVHPVIENIFHSLTEIVIFMLFLRERQRRYITARLKFADVLPTNSTECWKYLIKRFPQKTSPETYQLYVYPMHIMLNFKYWKNVLSRWFDPQSKRIVVLYHSRS